jgi:riboflavin synthase
VFSGIIQSVAEVVKTEKKGGSISLTIAKPKHWTIKPGDSVATDGVCLTVVALTEDSYVVDLMPETLSKTTFGAVPPKKVNLEQSLRVGDSLGGQVVTGHVDCVGEIIKQESASGATTFTISFPKQFAKLIAEKGSIAVNGVSLTVVSVTAQSFVVSVIEYTLKNTTLGQKKVGEKVNLEFDIIAKHLARMSEHL